MSGLSLKNDFLHDLKKKIPTILVKGPHKLLQRVQLYNNWVIHKNQYQNVTRSMVRLGSVPKKAFASQQKILIRPERTSTNILVYLGMLPFPITVGHERLEIPVTKKKSDHPDVACYWKEQHLNLCVRRCCINNFNDRPSWNFCHKLKLQQVCLDRKVASSLLRTEVAHVFQCGAGHVVRRT